MVSSTAFSSSSSFLSMSSALLSCSVEGFPFSFSASTLRKRSQSVTLKFHGLFLLGLGTGKSTCVTMGKWSAMGGVSSGRTSHMVTQFAMSLVIKTLSGLIWPGRGITLYRTIRFKERIQCIGPSEFTGPRESVNVIPNWEECITGNYWAYYTHRVALGDAAHDAGTKLLPRKCRISTMPVSIGMSENPGNRICAIFLPPQYCC